MYIAKTNCKYCCFKAINDVITEELCAHPAKQVQRSKWNPLQWFWGTKVPCIIAGTKRFNTYCTLQEQYERPAPPTASSSVIRSKS